MINTKEYIPTYRDRCEDPECPSYGKPLVDRGYGYPVCETQMWNPDGIKPMNSIFLE